MGLGGKFLYDLKNPDKISGLFYFLKLNFKKCKCVIML